jgi:hypothetical protein
MAQRKKSNPKTTWEQIGIVCVDTGCITIGDICRMGSLSEDEMYPGNALFKQISQLGHGRSGDKVIPTVVSLRTGLGDRYYPVMAVVEDDVVRCIMIDFLSDDYVKALTKHMAREKKEQAKPKGTAR